mgnify:CR=1 FL=1
MPWIQLKLNTTGANAEELSDALMEAGSVSITFQDTHDTPVFEPLPGETRLWGDTDVIGLFDAETDMKEAIAMLEQNPLLGAGFRHKIEQLEDKDWVREWMDHLIGGPARTRGRTNPDRFVKGDMLDSWQILGVDEGRRLDLLFNMKAPGVGRLEFNIQPLESGLTRLRVTAHWHPQGAWGLAYWLAMLPFHLFIFQGMTEAIARQAEAKAGIPVMD